jgi:hypothetical protein
MEALRSDQCVSDMAASPSSSHPPPREEDAAVCCMCGDHGLPRELFRCKSCRVRLQHSYCSNLYPRATAYRRCNWCLVREQSGAAAASPTKRKAATASDEERHHHQQRRHEGCSSRKPPAELGHPVKKKRKTTDDERAPDAGVKAGSCRCSNAGESSKELMRAGNARRVKVKVQRYKLLAEVISC